MKIYTRNFLETATKTSAFARTRKFEEIFQSMAYNHRVANEVYTQAAIASQASIKQTFASIAQTAAEIPQQTNTIPIHTSAALVASQWAERSQQISPSFAKISSMASNSALVNVAKSLELLSDKDFRISVASQGINHELESDPEGVIDNLLFKETSEPSNEFETRFFDILEQQRKILNDHTDILKEINESKTQNVPEKPSDEKHNSPAFYEDKIWCLEQIASGIIGAVIGDIISSTIGADKSNVIACVLLLGCLLQFIKAK
ncbi:hypothetical protein ACPCF3_00530 [Enterococcus mundtii]